MMGIKAYQEKLFYNFSLDDKVPEEHFLRKVDKVLDLKFVRELVKPYYSHTGKPSIDPVVLFKMMLIGYFYGITSERKLAQDISLNLAYMWYLGYDIDEKKPDHSVISKARARYGEEVFEKFFNGILEVCVKEGYVTCEKIFMDSTLIQANASVKSIVKRDEVLEVKLTPKEYVNQVFEENPIAKEESIDDSQNQGDKKNDTPKKNCDPAIGKKRSQEYRQKHISNRDYVSTTDPEASIIGRPNKRMQLKYKQHFAIDTYGRIITAVSVTPGVIGDDKKLKELIEKQPFKPEEVGADSKYGTVDNYEYLRSRDILPSIPRWHSPHEHSKSDKWKQDKFIYDKEKDVYICPVGKELKKSTFLKYGNMWAYKSSTKDCRGCKFRSNCLGEKSKRRRVCRQVYHEAVERAIKHLETHKAKQTIRERKIYAEWAIAEAKTMHGLRQTRYRGNWKVCIQAYLTASVQNIKRLVNYYDVDKIPAEIAKIQPVKEEFQIIYLIIKNIIELSSKILPDWKLCWT